MIRYNNFLLARYSETKRILSSALLLFRSAKDKGLAQNVDEYFFRLALDELCTNAFVHAQPETRTQGENAARHIEVCIRFTKKGVHITVKDGGEGFSLKDIPDPKSPERMFKRGGRGIFILNTIGKVKTGRGVVEVRL